MCNSLWQESNITFLFTCTCTVTYYISMFIISYTYHSVSNGVHKPDSIIKVNIIKTTPKSTMQPRKMVNETRSRNSNIPVYWKKPLLHIHNTYMYERSNMQMNQKFLWSTTALLTMTTYSPAKKECKLVTVSQVNIIYFY